ncbi:MAG: uroporphyrinogen decarboxylase family protein [Candidatus Sumerlaeota bacterium]
MVLSDVENALRIIRFENPERVMASVPGYDLSFHDSYDYPFRMGEPAPPFEVGQSRKNIWGVVTHKYTDRPGGTDSMPSIESVSDLETFPWPDPDDERICGAIYEKDAAFPGGDLWKSGGHGCLIWEIAYKMVGMQQLMEYVYTEPNFVKELFHRIVDFHLGIAKHYEKAGVTSVGFSDDLSTQRGPFFSPDIMREFFLPEYKRIFDFYRERNVIIGQHCDGDVLPLIDFFVDAGLNILNPVQVTANDLEAVRARTQGKICLHGGISNITVSEGPVERIEREVWRHIWILGKQGGYFCCIDHSMPKSHEHYEAYL